MDAKELERTQWLGVLGAGLIAAAITAVALPWTAQGGERSAMEVGRPAAAQAAAGKTNSQAAEGRLSATNDSVSSGSASR